MRILAALSGGVDSAVAASRLLQQGAEAIGIHLRTGVEGVDDVSGGRPSCCGVDDARDARAVAARLGIPFYVVDVQVAFGEVVRGFVDAYAGGRTPNPCVECNARVKFGRLAEIGAELGCEGVATGHYARRERAASGRWRLLRGRDRTKDQSYVLHRLDQRQLEAARFPLGASTKAEVRAEARALGLAVADKAESQDLCFVPGGDYRRFLREQAPYALVPGEFVDPEGRVVGHHDGAAGYTVGQRKGLPPTGRPRYVSHVDGRTGRVEVASRDYVLRRAVVASDVNWVEEAEPAAGACREVTAQHRYATTAMEARVGVRTDRAIEVVFTEPVFAPAPGQALVAYRGDAVLCGGTIARDPPADPARDAPESSPESGPSRVGP